VVAVWPHVTEAKEALEACKGSASPGDTGFHLSKLELGKDGYLSVDSLPDGSEASLKLVALRNPDPPPPPKPEPTPEPEEKSEPESKPEEDNKTDMVIEDPQPQTE
jgi:hypothetical protein